MSRDDGYGFRPGEVVVLGGYSNSGKQAMERLLAMKAFAPQVFKGSNVPSKSRKLLLRDGTYSFVVGRKFTQIWSPDGTKYVVQQRGLTGVYDDKDQQVITPAHIKSFVERGFTAILPDGTFTG